MTRARRVLGACRCGAARRRGAALGQPSVVAPGATSTPPPPGAPRAVRYPLPAATTLPNGLRVVAVRVPGSALLAADLVVPGGSVADPDAAPGVAALTAALLARGTAHRSAREIGLAEDALGATRRPRDDRPQRGRRPTRSRAVSRRRWRCSPRSCASRPSRADEIALAKQRATSAAAQQAGSPVGAGRAGRAAGALRAAPSGARPAAPRARSPRSTATRSWRTTGPTTGPPARCSPSAAISPPQDAFALARTAFGDWARRRRRRAGRAGARRSPSRALIVVDQPSAGRTAIVVARPAPLRSAPDYAVATMANAVLAGYSGRLNSEVRIKRGLSYGAELGLGGRPLRGQHDGQHAGRARQGARGAGRGAGRARLARRPSAPGRPSWRPGAPRCWVESPAPSRRPAAWCARSRRTRSTGSRSTSSTGSPPRLSAVDAPPSRASPRRRWRCRRPSCWSATRRSSAPRSWPRIPTRSVVPASDLDLHEPEPAR